MENLEFFFDLDSEAGEGGLPTDVIETFRRFIHLFYAREGRAFPWRETRDPYAILVSELMLQQTQTERVLTKYGPFLERFPDFQALAKAGLNEVFGLWRGLGYNRRAKALRDIAVRVVDEHGGRLPDEPSLLETFPGIGPYTARALCAFVFELPVAFIETNIRRVYLHCFFPGREVVHDRDILPLVEMTLDPREPRRWYYALMDYGAALRRRVPNPNTRSAHYTRQAPFENSNRQLRGRLLALLSGSGPMAPASILKELQVSTERVRRSLVELEEDGLLVCEKGVYRIAE